LAVCGHERTFLSGWWTVVGGGRGARAGMLTPSDRRCRDPRQAAASGRRLAGGPFATRGIGAVTF
jgi:hypothetical protein